MMTGSFSSERSRASGSIRPVRVSSTSPGGGVPGTDLEMAKRKDELPWWGLPGHRALTDIAILLRTSAGSFIWDCAAYLSPELVSYLETLQPGLRGIAISHPHVRYPSLAYYICMKCFTSGR